MLTHDGHAVAMFHGHDNFPYQDMMSVLSMPGTGNSKVALTTGADWFYICYEYDDRWRIVR